jgi:cell fate regulator YaaT (PSP1 superfamily)
MADIIGVKFKNGGKIYYFSPNNEDYSISDGVIVETARGVEFGEVALPRTSIPDDKLAHALKPVVRKATPADYKKVEDNRQLEQSAFKICEEKIKKHKLEMNLISVEYTFDSSKLLFCFTSDGRVDFRDLVKDLAQVFRTRIELRQIGVRDEAKMFGGLGVCGRPFCCATFLTDFQPVSIKMAKEQGLSLNPVKISGTCGRLMCCLKYEQDAYEDLIRRSPKNGMRVTTPNGEGTVTERLLLKKSCKVQLDGDNTVSTYMNRDLKWSTKRDSDYEEEEDDILLDIVAEDDTNLADILDESEKPKLQRNKGRSNNRYNGGGRSNGNHNNQHGRKPREEAPANSTYNSSPEEREQPVDARRTKPNRGNYQKQGGHGTQNGQGGQVRKPPHKPYSKGGQGGHPRNAGQQGTPNGQGGQGVQG